MDRTRPERDKSVNTALYSTLRCGPHLVYFDKERNEWRVKPKENQRRAMGNSYSQHHQIPINQWTHSYPRSKYGQSQVKVLPEKLPPLQLRTTDNGAILHNGGTISCKKKSIGHEEKIYRPRSNSAYRLPELESTALGKGRFGSEPDLRFYLKETKDQYSDNVVRQRISRSRKKYKAPPAPQNGVSSGMESSSPEYLNNWERNGKELSVGYSRKGRLFKTRAETNKKNLIILRVQEKKKSEISRSTEAINVTRPKFKEDKFLQNDNKSEKKGLKRSASQEVISTKKSLANAEFQAELLEAAQRLRPSEVNNCESPLTRKANAFKGQEKNEIFTNLNIEIPKEKVFEERQKIMKISDTEEIEIKSQKSGLCEELKEKSERDVPFKKFYFGMKENNSEINTVNNNADLVSSDNLVNNVIKTNAEHRLTSVEKSKNLMNLYKSIDEGGQEWESSVDRFYANFHKTQMSLPNGNITSCSSSFVSDPDEDVDGGIALRLRPTLPKKTPEIPRFSPTAAWRLLSSIDPYYSQVPSPGGSDDGPFLLEDRILPPESQQGLRTNHDKSGDSGISGDASPGGCHESSSEIVATSPKAVPVQNSKNVLVAWTPQQDLEEDSSSDDLNFPLSSSKNPVCKIPGARFSPRAQLFTSRDQSFSVPKEDRICLFAENADFRNRSNADLTPKLNSLKKIKVALANSKRSDAQEENNNFPNNNWVLSRSVPSSLNSHIAATRSLSNPSSPEQDDEYNQQVSLNHPTYSYLANKGRIMYLPEYHSRMSPDISAKKTRNTMRGEFLSKSCENITQPEMKQVERSNSPFPMGMVNSIDFRFQSDTARSDQKKKKFTFQSTVRLLENRRIAEKLSREAELKENQRLSELEAMKKVEEEFQKKRAREKANIRQQLRLFSLEEKNFFSLPSIDWEENRVDSTDGSPISLPQMAQSHSSRKLSAAKKVFDIDKLTPTTQILSEFRESTRNYKDYRHSRYHEPPERLPDMRSVVEHPRVVYDMPKNTAVYISTAFNISAQSQHKDETRAGPSTPRSTSSDNYRKEFANGALSNAGKSLTSSDSELSQSHPRPSSRQGFPSHGFTAIHRSRSVSPEILETTASFPRVFDSFDNSFKTVIIQRSRSTSPNSPVEMGTRKQSESPRLREKSSAHTKSERKLSYSTEHQAESLQVVNVDDITNKFEPCYIAKNTVMDSPLRPGFSSLQPFNKAEKSFRPINFNPERCMRVLRPT